MDTKRTLDIITSMRGDLGVFDEHVANCAFCHKSDGRFCLLAQEIVERWAHQVDEKIAEISEPKFTPHGCLGC